MWNNHKQWIFAVLGAGLVGNSGFVLNAAINAGVINLPVLAQALFVFFLPGAASVAYAVKAGSSTEKPTFSSDMQAIEHLAENCKGCKKAQAALEVITISTTQGLFKDA